MEAVTNALSEAFQKVEGEQGSPDQMGRVSLKCEHCQSRLVPRLTQLLLDRDLRTGEYPARLAVWECWGKGQRGLGISDVVDRTVHEAVRMVLEPAVRVRRSSRKATVPDRP